MRAHLHAGNLPAAERLCIDALAGTPDHVEMLHLLGVVAMRMGDRPRAIALMRMAVERETATAEGSSSSASAPLRYNLAEALRCAGQFDAAIEHYHAAIAIDPQYEKAFTGMAVALMAVRRFEDARIAAIRATEINPASAHAAFNVLGTALSALGQHDEAAAAFERSVASRPDYAIAWGNLGHALADRDRAEEAESALQRAVIGRGTARNHVRLATLVPAMYDSVGEIDRRRATVQARMEQLHADGIRLDLAADEGWPMTYLAYHGRNDRALMECAARLHKPPELPPPRGSGRTDGRLRLGIISARFCDHTIGRLNHGLIRSLPRERLHVTAISLGDHQDELGGRIAAAADAFVPLPEDGIRARAALADGGFDILLYTGIGMERATYTLAFSRLAPMQCATWGHPSTTGIDTIDYFISSEALDAPAAQEHYTERLVRLPNLAVCYDRPEIPPRADGAYFSLPAGANLYGCLQTLFKFHPSFDAVLADILRRDAKGRLVMIDTHPKLGWRDRLLARFGRTMADVIDRIHFVPLLDRADYLRLVASVDVLLDPLHFGGGNTSYEAFAAATPVVTLPSLYLKGRITAALYAAMGLPDHVANSPADYVDRAVRLGADGDANAEARRALAAVSDRLFGDTRGANELAEFFMDASARPAEGSGNWQKAESQG